MLATAEQEVAALQFRYLPDVKACLQAAVTDSRSGFFSLLRYHLGWEDADGKPSEEESGKALRPVLCLMACELAGGDWRRALRAAAALELVHNFSLIHDDIQDGDTTRRGRPTLWSVRGVGAALTAGNGMRVIADQTLCSLTQAGLPADTVLEASVELTLRYLEMIEGQFLDMSFESAERVTVDEYLDMIGRKTGALIQSALFLGALTALSDTAPARAFGECGRKLGLAFQVRDDYLGIWGDPRATGKAVGADIRRKKKSLPIIYLLEHTGPDDLAWVTEAYAEEEVSNANVQRMLELLDRLGAQAYVQQVAESHATDALGSVAELRLSEGASLKLKAMAEFFVTREK